MAVELCPTLPLEPLRLGFYDQKYAYGDDDYNYDDDDDNDDNYLISCPPS